MDKPPPGTIDAELHEALDRHRRDKAIATIRIQRPESKLNAWVIKFRRGNHVFELANLDLRWAIEAWRLARRAGKFE